MSFNMCIIVSNSIFVSCSGLKSIPLFNEAISCQDKDELEKSNNFILVIFYFIIKTVHIKILHIKNCTYKIVHLKNCLTITFFLSVSSEFFFKLFVCSSNSSMRLKCKFNSFLILEAYLTLGLPG